LAGDFSFDRFFLRGGGSGIKQFDFGELRFGTDWTFGFACGCDVKRRLHFGAGGCAFPSDKSFNLKFSGPIAQAYTVWAATNLALPFQSWVKTGGGTFGFDPVNVSDTNALNLPSRFYRITSP
jgi:hypothetical protein